MLRSEPLYSGENSRGSIDSQFEIYRDPQYTKPKDANMSEFWTITGKGEDDLVDLPNSPVSMYHQNEQILFDQTEDF